MATPRKHWFYVSDALGREPLSNDQLACAVRLMAHMNSRRSRDLLDSDAASRCVLRPGDLFEITGKGQLRSARALVDLVAMRFDISTKARGDLTEIEWPNLPIYQGWVPETREKPGKHHAREFPLPGTGAPTPAPVGGAPPDPGAPERVELLKRKPRQRAPKSTEPKPAHHACRIYAEEYKAARGANPAIQPKDKPTLGEIYADIGEEAMRGALRVFFALDDDWLRENSFSPSCFGHRLTMCTVRHEKSKARRPPEAVPEIELSPEALALFGGGIK